MMTTPAMRTLRPRDFILLAALCGAALALCACPRRTPRTQTPQPTQTPQGAKKVGAQDGTAEITFEVGGEKLVVRERDLDDIRQAVVAHLRQSGEEFRDEFVAELEQAPRFIDEDGVGRVGGWLLERRGEELRLVRHPPERGAVMFLFYATLAREGGRWKVTEFAYERVRGR